MLSWKQTAGHYRVDWKTVAAAAKAAVSQGLLRRKWKPLRVIGIDEVSRSKGQRFLTLVYDLERRRLVVNGPMLSRRSGRKQFQIHGAFLVEGDSPPGDYDLCVALFDGTRAITPVLPGSQSSGMLYVPIGPLPLPGRDSSAGS